MNRLVPYLSVLVAEPALAHPGHGAPGWIHPHAGWIADLALAGLAVFCVVLLWQAFRK